MARMLNCWGCGVLYSEANYRKARPGLPQRTWLCRTCRSGGSTARMLEIRRRLGGEYGGDLREIFKTVVFRSRSRVEAQRLLGLGSDKTVTNWSRRLFGCDVAELRHRQCLEHGRACVVMERRVQDSAEWAKFKRAVWSRCKCMCVDRSGGVSGGGMRRLYVRGYAPGHVKK